MDRNVQIEEAGQVIDNISFRTFRWPDISLVDSGDVPEEGSFIEMVPRLPLPMRFIERMNSGSQVFEFYFTTSLSPVSVISANELSDDGIIHPCFSNPSIMGAKEHLSPKSEPHSPKPFTSGSKHERESKSMPSCLVSRQPTRALAFFFKNLNILRPLYWIMGRGDTKKGRTTKSSAHPKAGPSVTSSFSSISVSESLIHEAILHCNSPMSINS
ncbi:hypothetical protein CDL15_Pgr028992 [Punica granatum]|uniref:Membrane-associated kinase regulator 6 n=1 Tax=Punica granatum TaxID=22663 RepID=A0A218XLM2_PUNGR|nr:hypothetical protein CDL15_Pgr028992 [Punica granatum]PKI57393.1 hypothetical protein CRG98_022238 [Punica granatum]